MRPLKTFVVLPLLVAVTLNAQKSDPARVMFEAARKKEVVDGDLPAAIEQYKSIVSRFKNDSAIVADALIHMAACYEKFNNAEARRIYERIVRDYPEQKDAVLLARTRLGVADPEAPKDISLRKVKNSGSLKISQDGRYVAGRFLYDLVSGIQRQWQEDAESPVTAPLISRDGTQIAYQSCTNTNSCEFRVATATESGAYKSRRLFRYEGVPYRTRDWSPDGKQVVVTALKEDATTQIGLVDVQNGTLNILKSVEWRGADAIFFSPDGKDFAFNLPENDTSADRDIYLMATDGSRLIPAVTYAKDDTPMGWSPDGKYLLFTSDRSGTNDLWALPFGQEAGGKPRTSEAECRGNRIPRSHQERRTVFHDACKRTGY
jgi:dipeptidyl aminopeptidase/acylaminoacyl peptidase